MTYRTAATSDAKLLAQLSSVEKRLDWQSLLPVFENEFAVVSSKPETRTYYLAFDGQNLVGYAGARSYEQEKDENMYGTSKLLPSGWYLRGVRVHPDYRRKGVARELTQLRLDWLLQRSKHIYVFLDDENKVSLPMYFEFGFNIHSKSWDFLDGRSTRGILLEKFG